MKKLLCILLACLFLFGGAVNCFAEGEITVTSPSAVLIEQNTGRIIFEKDKDTRLPPASITKIMSLLLVMEAMEQGSFTKETVLTCSDTASKLGGSQIWLHPGEQMTVDDLLKAVFVVSANDATVLLAEAVAGSEESFVALMNEKAKALGLANTNFQNATGLDAPEHYSSAYDIAVMAKELMKYPTVTDYTTIWMDSLRGGESELVNTNRLVRFYEGCTGLKTGTTATAGYCLCATANRGGLYLISVVLNSSSSADRFSDSQKLLNFGFANYGYIIKTPELTKNFIAVKKGVNEAVEIMPENDFSALIKKSDANKITSQIEIAENITAPMKKGSVVGKAEYFIDGESIGFVNIVTKEDCVSLNIVKAFSFIVKSLFSL